jgi:hypothetical protein
MNEDPANLVRSLDDLNVWRLSLASRLKALQSFLSDLGMLDSDSSSPLRAMIERLQHDKLVLAFVAEFSRGKSELINAIFFAEQGARILPASPGRTTMCPVELGYEPGEAPMLALLPIETRLDPAPLSELRFRESLWKFFPLDAQDPAQMSACLEELTRTQWVTRAQAEALGFWDESRPSELAPVNEAGLVEVPRWRHALINYAHPLLARGLVVLDTPGLNAVGTEAELTLSLLPTAHATVFIVAADAGVTQSDLRIWRDHLSSEGTSRFVVLNKVDTLYDPLLSEADILTQIDRQVQDTARVLEHDANRVFALSARQALSGRVQGDPALLRRSRVGALESALIDRLLPERRRIIASTLKVSTGPLEHHLRRQLQDQRRQVIEQLDELRSLRGKSDVKARMMLQRLQAESDDFERCGSQCQALRSIHARMVRELMAGLSSDRVREEVERLQIAISASLFNLGARKAWAQSYERLEALIESAIGRNREIRDMFEANFLRLNSEFGFALLTAAAPDLRRQQTELKELARSVQQALGVSQIVRLGQPVAVEQFRRMLVARLRAIFEGVSTEFEIWNHQVLVQMDGQIRERRKGFRARREAIQRIRGASLNLDQRLAELERQDQQLQEQTHTLSVHLTGVERVLSACTPSG